MIAGVRGQSLPGVEPRLPEAAGLESLPAVRAAGEPADSGARLAERLESVALVTWADGERVDLAAGLRASRDLPVPAAGRLARRLSGWIGGPLDEGVLAALADEILVHYDRHGFPVVFLEVPEQDLRGGELRLVVEIGRYGEIGVSRPRHGDPARVDRGMRLRTGEMVRREEIDAQLAWFGRTAFRRPRLFVSPGAEPASADLLIAFEESRPWRVNVGYENSGPDLLGRDRFLLGVSGWTPQEHLLAWQSVIGAPASSLVANALRWEIPFHASHQVLQIDAAYAEVRSRYAVAGIPVESTGTSWSLAARQRLPLPALGAWRQQWHAGFEVKGTDQFLLFGGGSAAPGEVVFVHATLGHELSRQWENGAASMESGLWISPGDLGGNNSDAAFRAYDPRADATYALARISGQGWWSPGGDWQLRLRGVAQAADSRLLPAEQFAVGGYQTVRGAGEREFIADAGWQASLELLSPLLTPRDGCAFRLLGFLDHAALESRGGPSSSLSGAGIGLRMQVGGRLDLRFDHGWRLDDSEQASHAGVILTF
jgi:hemolysin activation/secretion protein